MRVRLRIIYDVDLMSIVESWSNSKIKKNSSQTLLWHRFTTLRAQTRTSQWRNAKKNMYLYIFVVPFKWHTIYYIPIKVYFESGFHSITYSFSLCSSSFNRSHHISCFPLGIPTYIMTIYIYVQCLYNVQSKFAIVFIYVYFVIPVLFPCNFIWEIWKINWNWNWNWNYKYHNWTNWR